MQDRLLRSKQLRAALWLASGGRCARCGRALDPADWHADHTIPWSAVPDTNPHNMQALCPACNAKKGKQMLRQHQREMLEICRDSRFRPAPKTIRPEKRTNRPWPPATPFAVPPSTNRSPLPTRLR